MRLWILLLLISLVKAEITTSTTQATVEEGSSDSSGESSDTKEKRTPADEASLQNTEYQGYSEEAYEPQQRTQSKNTHPQNSASGPVKTQISYILQDQYQQPYAAASPQVSAPGQVAYIPLRSLLGAQGQPPKYNVPYLPGEQHQPGGTTFTVQYVPASSVYRSAGNSQKYELVSKAQQAPTKTPSSAPQNSLVYIPPGHTYPYLYSNPQYSAAQTYVQPQYAHPAAYAAPTPAAPHPQASAQSSGGIVYTLQPVVMTFALPGSQYASPPPPAAHNPLYAVLGGGARAPNIPPILYYPSPAVQPVPNTVSYTPQRQQVAYVLPSSAYTSSANQRLQQQAVTPRAVTGGSTYASSAPQNVSPAYRVRSQPTVHFQQVKG